MTFKQAKNKLDKVFSEYIRFRDSRGGRCSCITCGKMIPIKEAHAGHYIPRNILNTRWDERNVNSQCVGCNIWGKGKLDIYAIKLVEIYGDSILQELHSKRKKLWKPKTYELEELIKYYNRINSENS